jgi:hypothetical protein
MANVSKVQIIVGILIVVAIVVMFAFASKSSTDDETNKTATATSTEIEPAPVKEEKNNTWIWILIIGAAFACLIGYFFYNKQPKKTTILTDVYPDVAVDILKQRIIDELEIPAWYDPKTKKYVPSDKNDLVEKYRSVPKYRGTDSTHLQVNFFVRNGNAPGFHYYRVNLSKGEDWIRHGGIHHEYDVTPEMVKMDHSRSFVPDTVQASEATKQFHLISEILGSNAGEASPLEYMRAQQQLESVQKKNNIKQVDSTYEEPFEPDEQDLNEVIIPKPKRRKVPQRWDKYEDL